MGQRLSNTVTKTGDNGRTSLSNGERVSKISKRIIVIGDVDELNAGIGLTLTKLSPMTMGTTTLRETQHKLFDLGSELGTPGTTILTQEDVDAIGNQVDIINENLVPLKNSPIPGGTQAAARLHFCTTICRRAERSLWMLDTEEFVNPSSLHFLNRLSDLLFIMARQEQKGSMDMWRHQRPQI